MPKIRWISCKWNLVDDQDNDDGQSWSWVLRVFRQDIALENNLTIVCISSYLIQTKYVLMLIKGIWHKYNAEINHLMHFRALLWRDDQYRHSGPSISPCNNGWFSHKAEYAVCFTGGSMTSLSLWSISWASLSGVMAFWGIMLQSGWQVKTMG